MIDLAALLCGVAPTPAPARRDVPPTPLDFSAAWLRGQLPGLDDIQARRVVGHVLTRQTQGAALSGLERLVLAVFLDADATWAATQEVE